MKHFDFRLRQIKSDLGYYAFKDYLKAVSLRYELTYDIYRLIEDTFDISVKSVREFDVYLGRRFDNLYRAAGLDG